MYHTETLRLIKRIERANAQIRDIRTAVASFVHRNPYRISPIPDPKNTEWIWYLQIDPVPDGIEHTVAEALHNLRTPLDKMLTIGIEPSKLEKVKFPVAEDCATFERGLRSQSKYLSEEVIEYLRSLEVFPSGRGAILHALHHLNRRDKHHSILTPIRVGLSATDVHEMVAWEGFVLRVGSRRGKHLVPATDARPGNWNLVQPDPALQPLYKIRPPNSRGGLEFSAPYDDMELFTTTVGARIDIALTPLLDIAFTADSAHVE